MKTVYKLQRIQRLKIEKTDIENKNEKAILNEAKKLAKLYCDNLQTFKNLAEAQNELEKHKCNFYKESGWLCDVYFIRKIEIENDNYKNINICNFASFDFSNCIQKSYKDYEKISLGTSDIGSLILVAPPLDGETILHFGELHFGSDGNYSAYVVNDFAIIGEHYKLSFECDSWLKIYDDEGLTFKIDACKIKIFTAGNFGCIIQTIDF